MSSENATTSLGESTSPGEHGTTSEQQTAQVEEVSASSHEGERDSQVEKQGENV